MDVRPVAANEYDFIDFNCGNGASIDFAVRKLGGRRGLGFDKDERKVQAARAAGYEVRACNVAKLKPADLPSVRFSQVFDLLPRLRGHLEVPALLELSAKVSEEFVILRQPAFDADDYLAALNLRTYWSDWKANRVKLRSREIMQILDEMLGRRRFRRYILFNRTRILDSDDPAIHPISSPPEQQHWSPDRHGPKPYYRFQFPVYREIGALIQTQAKKLSEPSRRWLLGCDVVYDSRQA